MTRHVAPFDGLQIRFWGTRGSTPVSGPEFREFGGHTPCVEIRCGERLVIIDAGTGISALGSALGTALPDQVDILFSHLHLDHVAGLPFFKPAVLAGSRVIRTYCGNLDGASAEEPLSQLFSPPIFPITLDQMPARFEYYGFKAGEPLVLPDGLTVATHPLNHPGGATGFRLQHRGRSVCYISDIEHTEPWPDPPLTDFIRSTDLVIYDGMFSEAEYSRCKGWGHSTWEKGVELCRAADAKTLAIFHLYPGHDDAFLKAAEAKMQQIMPTAFIARDRQALHFAPLDVATVRGVTQVPAE